MNSVLHKGWKPKEPKNVNGWKMGFKCIADNVSWSNVPRNWDEVY
jgi:hypothetical protein